MKRLVLTAAIAGLPMMTMAQPKPMLVTGERWRLEVRRDLGALDFLVQPEGEEGFVSILRTGGEAAWYGYNDGNGEVRTSAVRPAQAEQTKQGTVTVTCTLDGERRVTHEAAYHPFDGAVLVVSRFSAETPPEGAGIVRAAPKLDVDIGLLTHYAFVDGSGRRHTGAIADLGERDVCAGVGAWGGGDVATGFSGELPYMLLYNPEQGVSLGVAFPMLRPQWRGVRSFLQLYHGDFNFWYTGFLGPSALRKEHAFILYTRQVSGPEELERELPGLLKQAEEASGSGEVDAPRLRAMLEARKTATEELPALAEHLAGKPPTRDAWVASLMVRAARERIADDPERALALLERAKQRLAE